MRATLIISNDRHHAGIARPVGRELVARGHSVTVVSLCELRGTITPVALLESDGFRVRKATPSMRRSKGASASAGRDRLISKVAREAVFRAVDLATKDVLLSSDAVLMMNDHAYPYLGIADSLRRHGVPFVLAQEGVRFPMPDESDTEAYGRGGADFVAVWGETSLEHFSSRGVPRHSIRVTGCPRFDDVRPDEWRQKSAELIQDLGWGEKTVLGYFSNLVDMQGFCTTDERIQLFGRFLDGIRPLIEADPNLVIALRLHPAEDMADFRRLIDDRVWSKDRVIDANKPEMFPLLMATRAVVVLSSTVGLEAAIVDRPVGVMELRGFGFAHDYVRLGMGLPLHEAEPLAPQVSHLIGTFGEDSRAARKSYLEKSLRLEGSAGSRIADLMIEASASTRPRSRRSQVVRAIVERLGA